MGEKTIFDKRFGRVPYKDARKSLTFTSRKTDWKSAVARDPARCGLSRSVTREHNEFRRFGPRFLGAKFMKSCAVLWRTQYNGQTIAERYLLDSPTKRVIIGLDDTGAVPTRDLEIVLKAPYLSHKLGRGRRRILPKKQSGKVVRTWKALHRGTIVMDPTAPEPKKKP